MRHKSFEHHKYFNTLNKWYKLRSGQSGSSQRNLHQNLDQALNLILYTLKYLTTDDTSHAHYDLPQSTLFNFLRSEADDKSSSIGIEPSLQFLT